MVLEQPKIEDLLGGTDEEHKFAWIAYQLMNGIDIDDSWLQIAKLNNPESREDTNIYEVDYGVKENGEIIGYIDLEKKVSWKEGVWQYPKTNIALYPMSHWIKNRFNGNHTVKLKRFSQKPNMSFWIGVRNDWQAHWILPFLSIRDHGVRTTQRTRYSDCDLPIIEVANQYGYLLENADEFTAYVTYRYMRYKNEPTSNI